MAACFCGCGSKVPFGIRAANKRGRKILALVDRIDGVIANFQAEEDPPDLQNLIAFRDEGRIAALTLATYIHVPESPPDELEEITRSWLTRERKLYLDTSNQDRAYQSMLGAAISARNEYEEVLDAETAARQIRDGEFDFFAALLPRGSVFSAVNQMMETAVETDVIETVTPYRHHLLIRT